jgi:branched-chain amino acid transport system ATP-binding protein
MSLVLVVEGLGKSFNGVRAVADVSFTVAAGEMVALIGPNGAGKSTIFNMVGGQLRPDAGYIRLGDRNIAGLAPRQIWREGVGRTFQIAQTFYSMSVIENIQMALISARNENQNFRVRAAGRYTTEAYALLDKIGMASAAKRSCGSLAYAEIKRVEFAIALAGSPRLLLMDEPTAGMGLRDRADLMALVAGVAREQRLAVLFTEHDINAVFKHADRIFVLVRGQVIADGSAEEVRGNERVRQSYFGRHTVKIQPGNLPPPTSMRPLSA